MKKRPNSIKIKNVKYKTKLTNKAWFNKHEAYGMCYTNKKIIELTQYQDPTEFVDTLIHELLHSIFHEYGIKMSDKREEKVVAKLANGLTDMFRDNKKLGEWIIKKL